MSDRVWRIALVAVLTLLSCSSDRIVPTEKISEMSKGMNLTQVVALAGKPTEAWKGSEFGTTTEIVFLYHGEASYHLVWFTSLAGTAVVEETDEWIPDLNKVRDGLKKMAFYRYELE